MWVAFLMQVPSPIYWNVTIKSVRKTLNRDVCCCMPDTGSAKALSRILHGIFLGNLEDTTVSALIHPSFIWVAATTRPISQGLPLSRRLEQRLQRYLKRYSILGQVFRMWLSNSLGKSSFLCNLQMKGKKACYLHVLWLVQEDIMLPITSRNVPM